MRALRFLTAAAFSLACVAAFTSGEAEAAKKATAKNHTINGIIESVSHKGKETILHVKTNGKKAGQHTVLVDPGTTVEKRKGKNTTPATVANLHKGEHVVVHMQGRKATKVDIVAKKKKAKKNK